MASNTDICNLALIRARVGEIGDYNESSAEATKCRVLYPMARDYVLAKHPWRFAKRVKALALTTVDEPPEWQYEYDYPNDCIRTLYVLPPGVGQAVLRNVGYVEFEPIPYEVYSSVDEQTKLIGCNYEYAYLAYTRRVTNNELFSDLFVQAVAWWLSADLALSFGGDSAGDLRQVALTEFKYAISEAAAQDANQAKRQPRRMPRNLQAAGSSNEPSYYYYSGQFYRAF